MNKELRYKKIIEKGIDLELLKDIAELLEDNDKYKTSIVVSLTKKLLDGYIISNNGLTTLVAMEIAKVYEKYREESSDIIVKAMFEEINGRRYAVGINTFITRLNKVVKVNV